MCFTWCYAILIYFKYCAVRDVRFTTIVNLFMLLAVRIPVAFIGIESWKIFNGRYFNQLYFWNDCKSVLL